MVHPKAQIFLKFETLLTPPPPPSPSPPQVTCFNIFLHGCVKPYKCICFTSTIVLYYYTYTRLHYKMDLDTFTPEISPPYSDLKYSCGISFAELFC